MFHAIANFFGMSVAVLFIIIIAGSILFAIWALCHSHGVPPEMTDKEYRKGRTRIWK